MKHIIFALLIATAFISTSKGDVFEAASSADVDTFINEEPEKNRAVLFYDEVQEVSQKDVHKRDDKIISIFLKKGEKDRLKEDWVDKLKDGVNLMLVDSFKKENSDIVKKFSVKSTPYIIIFENHKTQFESVVDDKTFDKVKELLLKSLEDKKSKSTSNKSNTTPSTNEAKPKTASDTKKASETKIPHFPQYQSPQASTSAKKDDKSKSTDKSKPASTDKSKSAAKPNTSAKKGSGNPKGSEAPKKSEDEQAVDDALKELEKAKKMNEDAQKEVKKATDALEKAKKDMVEYAKVENAQKNAKKAQEETEKALKKYQDAKKKLDTRISSIKKNVGSPSPSPLRTSHTIPPPQMSYPAYNQPAPFVSQMLNPNYANPYSSYQRGPRRMY